MNPFKVGDILYSSWGYDQTNIDFFQVVKATDKSVWIREIEGIKEPKGHLHGEVTALKDKFCSWSLIHKNNEAVSRNLKNFNNTPYINIKGYNSAFLWDGKPLGYSEWA